MAHQGIRTWQGPQPALRHCKPYCQGRNGNARLTTRPGTYRQQHLVVGGSTAFEQTRENTFAQARETTFGQARETTFGQARETTFGQARETTFGQARETTFGQARETTFGQARETTFGQARETTFGQARETTFGQARETTFGQARETTFGQARETTFGQARETTFGQAMGLPSNRQGYKTLKLSYADGKKDVDTCLGRRATRILLLVTLIFDLRRVEVSFQARKSSEPVRQRLKLLRDLKVRQVLVGEPGPCL
ncbi:hypothetical protein C7974DRAFT_170658 [Boeremia exigua]|uniref:uncharacterized protein n=1 Tax=Boeremia exigua TaxID=749465 RepID=UPI001E8D9C6F|nr:uncharacterized protein C7974DRAFT_170658 [Boeremia exigua]KAH6633399.1 hypothetical protein C7974DRAFT_170658 [Boeremia exigua]